MTDQPQPNTQRGVAARRFILGLALVFAICAWIAVVIGYFMQPSLAVWTILVTIAAISLEVLMWTAAGVFGWSFLAKRRATMQRWFGKRRESQPGSDAET
jgi:cytochrome c biogenesis protein CcdA